MKITGGAIAMNYMGSVFLSLHAVRAACGPTCAAALLLAAFAWEQEAGAADIGASPEEDAAQAEPRAAHIPEFKWGTDDHFLKFSGQTNKGYLSYYDGFERLDYWLVDNNNSGTRGRLEFYGRVDDDLVIRAMLEAQWDPYSTAYVNQTNRGEVDWDTHLLRKAEIWFDHEMYGRLWLGQGSMASDGTAEVDLSGTSVVGYSSIADLAAGQFLRSAGTNLLTSIQIGDGFSNHDGLSRLLRVRYDTPSIGGLRLSASYGTKVVPSAFGKPGWDAVIRYNFSRGDLNFEAAGGYAKRGDGSDQFSGSASVLFPYGFNVTVAAATKSKGSVNSHYYYGKLGYIAEWFDIGKTAFAIDGYWGNNFNVGGSKSDSYGFFAVQNIDYLKVEVYVGVRKYDYTDLAASYLDSLGILAGARMKF